MRRLMLLRHAKSDWSQAGARDHDRVLNPRGREAAPRIGAYMAGHGLTPDRVICSTASRTRETWELAAKAFPAPPPVVHDARIYESSPATLLAVVKESAPEVHALLLVGHNPGMHELADLMIATGDLEGRQRLREKFPTAGLAVIDFPVDAWNQLHPRSGRFDRLVTPRLIDTATD